MLRHSNKPKSLVLSQVLAHYNPKLLIKMAADASTFGVGAVILHIYPMVVRNLFLLRCVPSRKVKRTMHRLKRRHWPQYLYRRTFTLVTDRNPLITILGPKKGIPSLAAVRLQRWAILLSAYHYESKFKPTSKYANAEGLSPLPLHVEREKEFLDVGVFNVAQVDSTTSDISAVGAGNSLRSSKV